MPGDNKSPVLTFDDGPAPVSPLERDIDTEGWKAPKGLGEEKIRNIQSRFAQQRNSLFSILMYVRPETARDLPSFISQLREWEFAIVEP
jgi:peptidoglycan-N-acetylglucosamine deacetylase